MFSEEPDLQFTGADDVADQQVVGAVVALFGGPRGGVVRVDQDFGEIGSRPSSAPKNLMTSKIGIAHVGESIAGATRSNNSDNR